MAELSYPLWILNQYRTAEFQGADLLQRILRRNHDPQLQINLSHHFADEARHAWLWTELICKLGGTPIILPNTYQQRLRRQVGLPSSMLNLLALSHVVEERVQQRYRQHAARPDEDPRTVAVLRTIIADEKWHLSWVEEWLAEQAKQEGQEQVGAILERYRSLEAQAYAELAAEEESRRQQYVEQSHAR